MLKVEEKMKPILEKLGFKYDRRRGEFIKHKDWFMETVISYNLVLSKWEGYLAFKSGVISSRDSLKECIGVINSRYEALEYYMGVIQDELRKDDCYD